MLKENFSFFFLFFSFVLLCCIPLFPHLTFFSVLTVQSSSPFLYSILKAFSCTSMPFSSPHIISFTSIHPSFLTAVLLSPSLGFLFSFQLTDQLKVAQGELQTQVQELDRAKKVYYEEEHVAHDAREKASAAEEK